MPDKEEIEFYSIRNTHPGPGNTTFEVINLAWGTQTMTKILADCGNANDPRNREFAEWLTGKLEAARLGGESLPFLRRYNT